MKYQIKFSEVADSDYTYIDLVVDGLIVARNYNEDEEIAPEQSVWLNQTIEGDAVQDEIDLLIKMLKLDKPVFGRVKIGSDEDSVHVECPCCGYWEQIGVDDPRKRLNSIPILDWKETDYDDNEVSVNQCTNCKTIFDVEWDYENPIGFCSL